MTTPTMPTIMVEAELGKTIKINTASGPLVPGRYEVNADGVTIVADSAGVLSAKGAAISNTVATGHKIADLTAPDGTITTLNETITEVKSITDGFSYTAEDGTVKKVTFTLNTASATNPKMEVKLDGTVIASVPVNYNDLHIDYTGSEWDFADDEITITETVTGDSQTLHFPYRVTATTLASGAIEVYQDGILKFTVPAVQASISTTKQTITEVVQEDIPLARIGNLVTQLGAPSAFYKLIDGAGAVLKDASGNTLVIPVFAVDSSGNFV